MEFSYHFQIDVDFLQEWHYCQPLFQGLPFDPSMVFFRLFSSFFGRFYKISIGATLFFFGLGFSGRIKGKKQKQKQKKIFSGISFMGDKKRVVFVYFICQHVPYSVGDARSFTSWGVLQDFFSRVYLSDRRKSMLFWEQASRQALLICVFLFFWEASGVNFRALIVLGKGVNPVDRRTTMRWTRFFFFFLVS